MTSSAKKILIIGNSFIGAVMKAYELSPAIARGATIDFAGAGGINYQHIRVVNGQIENARTTLNSGAASIREYDTIFVYGGIPNPHEIAALKTSLESSGFSSQVVQAALRDYIETSVGVGLYREIKAAVASSVFAISGNVASNSPALTGEDYQSGIELLRSFLGDSYHPFPQNIFSRDLVPKPELYRGSVRINGSKYEGDKPLKHDVNHMNEEGGAIVLRSIVEATKACRRFFDSGSQIR